MLDIILGGAMLLSFFLGAATVWFYYRFKSQLVTWYTKQETRIKKWLEK